MLETQHFFEVRDIYDSGLSDNCSIFSKGVLIKDYVIYFRHVIIPDTRFKYNDSRTLNTKLEIWVLNFQSFRYKWDELSLPQSYKKQLDYKCFNVCAYGDKVFMLGKEKNSDDFITIEMMSFDFSSKLYYSFEIEI